MTTMDTNTADYLMKSLVRDLKSVAASLESRAADLRHFVTLIEAEVDEKGATAFVGATPFLSNITRELEDARRPVLNSMSTNGIVDVAGRFAYSTLEG